MRVPCCVVTARKGLRALPLGTKIPYRWNQTAKVAVFWRRKRLIVRKVHRFGFCRKSAFVRFGPVCEGGKKLQEPSIQAPNRPAGPSGRPPANPTSEGRTSVRVTLLKSSVNSRPVRLLFANNIFLFLRIADSAVRAPRTAYLPPISRLKFSFFAGCRRLKD